MRKKMPNAVGLSALLVIFAVLCLTVFAILSLSSVCAYERLAEKSRQATLDYYRADCKAEEILAQMRSDGDLADGVYEYCCPLSDTQTLAVTVSVTGADYEIIQWQTRSVTSWQPDEHMPVWSNR